MALSGKKLFGTGDNSYGQLGIGNNINKNVFTPLTGEWDYVACGANHTMALSGKKLFATGANYFGQLGSGNYDYKNTFTLLDGEWDYVTCGENSTFAGQFAKRSSQMHVYGLTTDNWSAGGSTWSSLSSILKQNVPAGTKIENNVINNQGTTNLITGQLSISDIPDTYGFRYVDVTNYIKPTALAGQNTASILLAQDHRWDYDVTTQTFGDLQPYGISVKSRDATTSQRPKLIVNQLKTPTIISNVILPPVPPPSPIVQYDVSQGTSNTQTFLTPINPSSNFSVSTLYMGPGITKVAASAGFRTTNYLANASFNTAMNTGEYFQIDLQCRYNETIIGGISGLYINSNTRGPRNLAIIYSTNNFQSWSTIAVFAIPKNVNVNLDSTFANWFTTNKINILPVQTVSFRIVPYNTYLSYQGYFTLVKINASSRISILASAKPKTYQNTILFTTNKKILIGQYDIGDVVSTNNKTISPKNINSNVKMAPFLMGPGITVDNTSDSMRGRGFGTSHTSITAAVLNDEYFSFNFTPITNYSLKITGISGIQVKRNSTGPANVALIYNESDYFTEYSVVCDVKNLPVDVPVLLDPYIIPYFNNTTHTLAPGITGNFRIVPYSASSASNGYFEIMNRVPNPDISLYGTLRPLNIGEINPSTLISPLYTQLTTTSNIVYKTVLNANSNSINLDFDVYQCSDAIGSNRPVVIFVHGGGFTTATQKTQSYTVSACKEFAKRGYVAFAPEYRRRQSPPVSYSKVKDDIDGTSALIDAVIDIQDFVNYIRPLSATYKFNPNYIFLGGGSAGGVITSNVNHHTGTIDVVPDSSYLDPAGPRNPSRNLTFYKNGIKGAFVWWGSPFYATQNPNLSTSKFPEVYPYTGDYRMYGEGRYTILNILTATDTQPPSAGFAVIPNNSIPTIILHGSGDDVNPLLCATTFYSNLTSSNTSAKLYLWPGADHSLTRYDEFPGVVTNTNNFFIRRMYNIGAN